MDLNGPPRGKRKRKGKIVYNQIQKETLLACFKKSSHPDKVTMEQLAKEIGVPASKIKVWFKNYRWMQLKSRRPLGEDQFLNNNNQLKPWTHEWLTKASQELSALTTTQKRILAEAFEKDPFPDSALRKKLAKETGIKESRILIWFQNQNSLYPDQHSELLSLLVECTDERPDVTLEQQHVNLSMLPCESHHFPPSSSSCSKETFVPAPFPSDVSLDLWDPFQVSVTQEPSVTVEQPTQAMEGGESSEPPLTFKDHLLKLLAPAETFADTQAPFCYQDQEKCQNDQGYNGTGAALQGKNHSQSDPEHKEQEFPDLSHTDLSYIIQWWDKGCKALMAEWQPLGGTP